MTLPPSIQQVADALLRHGILFVFDNHNRTLQASWQEVSATCGRSIAVAHHYGGRWEADGIRSRGGGPPARTVWVAFDQDQPHVRDIIRNAFEQAGHRTTWDGPGTAIRVNIAQENP